MVDKFEKAKRSQKLKDLGIRKVGIGLRLNSKPRRRNGTEYLVAYACFSCCCSFKHAPSETQKAVCPNCGETMVSMGRSFKAPRKNNTKQWKKVQRLWEAGYRFPTNSSQDAADYPKRLSEVDEFIRQNPKHPFRLKEHWPPG